MSDASKLFYGLGRDSYVDQPYIARVSFSIGTNPSILLTGGYQEFSPTQYSFTLISFEHVMEDNGMSQTFSITLFDPNWLDLESRLFEGGNNVRFSYEYVSADGTARTPGDTGPGHVFEGHITKWSPTLTMGGTTLAIDGISKYGANRTERTGSYGGNYSSYKPEEQKAIDKLLFAEEGGLLSKASGGLIGGGSISPSEIAKAIAKARGYETQEPVEGGGMRDTITATEPVKSTDDLNKTEGVAALFQRSQGTDISFLKNLCRYSKVAGSGEDEGIGYDVWESTRPDGKTVLHFEPLRSSDKVVPNRIFTFLYGYRNSEVISFNPNIQVDYLLSGPGVEHKTVAMESTSKVITEIIARADAGGKREGQSPAFYSRKPPEVKDSANVFEGGEGASQYWRAVSATPSFAALRNVLYSIWYQNFVNSNTAELVIQGDPRFSIHDPISVYVMLPPNYDGIQSEIGTIHPCSGPYRVKKITHRIQGSWITTLELYRAGILAESPDPAMFYNSAGGERPLSREVPLHPYDHKDFPEPGAAASTGFAGAAAAGAATLAPMAPIRCGEVGRGLQEGHRRRDNKGPPYRHDGVDIGTGKNQPPVYAPQDGTVTYAGTNGTYGNFVEVTSADGTTKYRYAHLSEINVTKDQPVSGGAQVGSVGSTGRSTGNHLHFEVLVGGVPVDPSKYVILPTEMCK